VVSETDDFELLTVEGFSSQQVGENGENDELVGEVSEYIIASLNILSLRKYLL